MTLNITESWCRDDKAGTESYVGFKGDLPAKNLRDQPGLYRSDGFCGVDANGFDCDEAAGLRAVVMDSLSCEVEAILLGVTG